MKSIPIFIGYDTKETIAYHTCVNSIIRYSTNPISINPLSLEQFEELYNSAEVSEALQSLDKATLSFEYLLADYVYNKNSI